MYASSNSICYCLPFIYLVNASAPLYTLPNGKERKTSLGQPVHPYVRTQSSRLSSIRLPLRNHHLIIRLHLILTRSHMRRRNLADISQHRQHSWRLIYVLVTGAVQAESSDSTPCRLQRVEIGVIAAINAYDHETSSATRSSVVSNEDVTGDLVSGPQIHHLVVVCSFHMSV